MIKWLGNSFRSSNRLSIIHQEDLLGIFWEYFGNVWRIFWEYLFGIWIPQVRCFYHSLHSPLVIFHLESLPVTIPRRPSHSHGIIFSLGRSCSFLATKRFGTVMPCRSENQKCANYVEVKRINANVTL